MKFKYTVENNDYHLVIFQNFCSYYLQLKFMLRLVFSKNLFEYFFLKKEHSNRCLCYSANY